MLQLKIWTLGVVVAFAMTTNSAQAAYYIEGTGGTGDAGELLGTSQNTTGVGAFQGIIGRLALNPAHVDLYRIYATGGAFSASTNGGATFDTQLFLFDALGMGVIGNDDISGSNVQSSFSTTLTAGFYYIGISAYNNDPLSSGGAIFTDNFPGVNTPTGPGAAFALSGWIGGSAGTGRGGEYTINIEGASFGDSVHPTPAPAGVVLFGLGFAGLGMFRSFRKGSKVTA